MNTSIWDDMEAMNGFCLFCENKLQPDEHIISYTFKGRTIRMNGNYCKKCKGLSEVEIRIKLIEKNSRT